MIFLLAHARILVLHKVFASPSLYSFTSPNQFTFMICISITCISGEILLISVCGLFSSFFMKHYAIRIHGNRDLATRK